MKELFALVLSVFVATATFAAAPSSAASAPEVASSGPKTKEVCKEVKGKDGKVTKTCKTIKIHKKLEGTKVPDAKK